MSPLNRGPLLGPRVPPAGIRPPPLPRFGGRLPPPRMLPPPMSPVFGPMRQMLPPPPRPGGAIRPNGVMPLFGPRGRGMAPMVPPMGMRGTGPRGPMIRPWPRRVLPPLIMSHMRPRFGVGNGSAKGKAINNAKKVSKLEELELKKPWMTDEIRSEIQKKNKLYAKAKKNKDAKEWEEFKDLRNKVTRMIRDAKNEYLTKHPEQGGQKTDDKNTNESEGVQKTENATKQSEQMELTEETQPSSEQAHLYPEDDAPYDQRDENSLSCEEETYYCEICDRDFQSETELEGHKNEHKVCGVDGCTFSAHPLLVERHISMQHRSGLYHRIKNVSSPEDIEKWLMERKKRYPTKANVELRKAEEMEKSQRGEVIKQQSEVIKQKERKIVHSRDRKRTAQKRAKHVLDKTPVQDKEMYRGIYNFPGTLRLNENSTPKIEILEANSETIEPIQSLSYISDEEEPGVSNAGKADKTLPILLTNIPNLVANYGSDSDDSGPEVMPIKKLRVQDERENAITNTEVSEINTNDETTNLNHKAAEQEEAKQSTHPTTVQKYTHAVNKNSTTKEASNRKKPFTKRPPNGRLELLHRLLSRSIQHERNLVCQCIKYIVDNNYFD